MPGMIRALECDGDLARAHLILYIQKSHKNTLLIAYNITNTLQILGQR